jgi:N-methylhydantoinase A
MGIFVSVDTGGTHTDIVVIDRDTDSLHVHKVPTTPGRLSDGVLDGVTAALERNDLDIGDVERLVYGTTLVTNIIIERDAVPVGLITTENFRDILAIGRAYRNEHIYDLTWRPAEPLVPRYLRRGVTERIDAQGRVLTPLDEKTVREALHAIVSEGVDTIAICLLNSYVNPTHEQRIAEIARTEHPHLRLSISSEIMREFREYERTSTTVANAFVMRPIEEHLDSLEHTLKEAGLKGAPLIMRSNGGVMGFDSAKRSPVALTHSGPMGGIIGSAVIARTAGTGDLITLDMGGTSTDVALISNGTPRKTTSSTVAGMPVKLPTLDLITVGAGGGSIAWLDDAGAMKVGPRSAGARPGPACYGRGGEQPTITDANLLLGRLNPEWFLAGAGTLNVDLARAAVQKIAEGLDISLTEAALGIVAIGESHMVNAIKLASVKQGVDPRDMALVGFGGAGPLHTLGLAQQMDIKRAIIPCAPGNMSALGMLTANLSHDFVRSLVRDLGALEAGELSDRLNDLIHDGRDWLDQQATGGSEPLLLPSVDIRYRGQSHELTLPLADPNKPEALVGAFHAEHERVYGYSMPEDVVQITNVRLTAVGQLEPGTWRRRPVGELAGCRGERDIWFDATGPAKARIWRADGLLENEDIRGPAVIEFAGSTFIVPLGWSVRCDALGHLHCEATK